MIAELRLDAAARGLIVGPHARRSQRSGHARLAVARTVADGHRRARLHHAVRSGDRSRQRALRREPQFRRHARPAGRQRRHQALRTPSSTSTSSTSRCARSRWKRASSPTTSSSAPPRKAGDGTLASSGKIEWRDGLPYGDIHLGGENLRLVDVPEARIDASPDLDFRIAAPRHLRQGRSQTTAGAHRSRPT